MDNHLPVKRCFAFIISLLLISQLNSFSQPAAKDHLVYVDKQGVMRWTKNKQEASFFGVNYTVPFAYGYRSVKALGIDPEKAIADDVYHMSRLGLDAFRVHMWDVEISDSLGNLLENEHLRLFDYLIQKLKERNIKILITPIAFWGNGYPERDEKTNGFSSVYGKGNSVVLEAPIKAQENYLQQIVRHVNPYTHLSYSNDPDIIALEINNEPHHSGLKEKTTEYINRLTASAKNAGWTKPVFYNISESPTYADAVVKANVEGHSFQWYPTGLVAGHEQKGNFLPHVDQYFIPFSDTIPLFRNRTKMVYEFDAGDVFQSNMYPAMARSFRTAGFQWATQFAYDPMATAYGNTEYQTHYLNLAYTPAKAISLLIASKAFHKVPRLKSYGSYPADTTFDVFRVSYNEQLSEMNSNEEFYYSNSTSTTPKNSAALLHIAGTGSSPVVRYEGYGAYFLDKINAGSWRLEVMPDALYVKDPFEKASPKKEVTRIQWQSNRMEILLPGLETGFSVKALNKDNVYATTASGTSFTIQPGVYLIQAKNAGVIAVNTPSGEFAAPKASGSAPFIIHQPLAEVSAGKPFPITIRIAGIDSAAKVSVELRHSSNKWKTVPLQHTTGYDYTAQVPADIVMPGLINYRVMVQKSTTDFYTFPGGVTGNPYAWDNVNNDSWKTFVAAEQTPLVLFNATEDRSNLVWYNTDWRNNSIEYITTGQPNQLVLKMTMNKPSPGKIMGWQFFFSDRIKGRADELSSATTLVIRARASQELPVKISLITTGATAFATQAILTNAFRDIEIPLTSLQGDSLLLLPRPYPGFLPLRFRSATETAFDSRQAEKLELSFGQMIPNSQVATGIEVESIWLKK